MYTTEKVSQSEIYDLLYRLGAVADSCGFFQTAYAIKLSMERPERLTLVTKWLYPEVARQYGTNWRAVERNIRRSVRRIWKTESVLLSKISRRRLYSCPTPAQFIALLAAYLSACEPESGA